MAEQENLVIRGSGYGWDYATGRRELLKAKKAAAAERLGREATTGIHEQTYAETVVAQMNEESPIAQGEQE